MCHQRTLNGRVASCLSSLLAVTLLATACSDVGQTGPNTEVTRISITPDSVPAVAGEVVQFHAVGLTANGESRPVAVTWQATGGTIDANGVYTVGDAPGDFDVTATLDNSSLSAKARIRNRGKLRRVDLQPDSARLAPGASQQFSAVGLLANGNAIPIQVEYSATGGSIDSSGLYLAGQTAGSYAVIATVVLTAHAGGVQADTSPVTITGAPPTLAQIVLTPASVTLGPGATQQFHAYGRTANGDSVAVGVIYSATGGAIDAAGLYTAGQAPGAFQVIATDSGGTLADTSQVTISAAPPTLAQVVLVPPSVSLATGATQQFQSYGRMSNGDSVAVSVNYSATGGTITSAGLYSAGQTAGSFQVIAVQQGGTLADTSSVTITASTGTVVLVGAGDIAECGSSGDEATANLLDGISGTVFTTGDNAYPDGTASNFSQCYDPSWGRHKTRTRPSPGNHDYHTSGASAYYAYFGALAGPAGRGYYSYDLGDWHIVSLNSEISMSAGSAQEQWLRADLAANTRQCTLAYWHSPRFSSGSHHGSDASAQPLWQALVDFHAEIVLNGHEHNYERFAPQTPTGAADPVNGIREFVVGTGGGGLYDDASSRLPNSEVFNGTTWGVLKLTLGSGTYSWQFVPVAGKTFTDSGSGTCH